MINPTGNTYTSYVVSGEVDINYIHQNFPFALQSYRNQYNYQTITMRVNPHFHSQQVKAKLYGSPFVKLASPLACSSEVLGKAWSIPADIHNWVLPLTLQSEIKQHQIISLIKGNC